MSSKKDIRCINLSHEPLANKSCHHNHEEHSHEHHHSHADARSMDKKILKFLF